MNPKSKAIEKSMENAKLNPKNYRGKKYKKMAKGVNEFMNNLSNNLNK